MVWSLDPASQCSLQEGPHSSRRSGQPLQLLRPKHWTTALSKCNINKTSTTSNNPSSSRHLSRQPLRGSERWIKKGSGRRKRMRKRTLLWAKRGGRTIIAVLMGSYRTVLKTQRLTNDNCYVASYQNLIYILIHLVSYGGYLLQREPQGFIKGPTYESGTCPAKLDRAPEKDSFEATPRPRGRRCYRGRRCLSECYKLI